MVSGHFHRLYCWKEKWLKTLLEGNLAISIKVWNALWPHICISRNLSWNRGIHSQPRMLIHSAFWGVGVNLFLAHLCFRSTRSQFHRHHTVGFTQSRKPPSYLSRTARSSFILNHSREALQVGFLLLTLPYFPFPNLLIFIGKSPWLWESHLHL